MGDHIDYNGLSVLPMALARHVSVLYREREDNTVLIASTDERYEPRSFTLAGEIEPYTDGDWGNYIKAAAQALTQRFEIARGYEAIVHSDIPVAAGLSSSSALVVASALALLHGNAVEMERLALAELLAEAERYVGTRGGGMDQAICLAARKHSASRIDFHPLRLTAHLIPPEWHFIVASSLVPAEKAGVARETYNTRARECREALARVIDAIGASDRIDSYTALLAASRPAALLRRARDILDEALLSRFCHVVNEAGRVRRAEKALTAYDLRGFGRLMSESHRSLRDDFQVSCPELDELVEIAENAGAAGARLTGAGLGGCIVALCPENRSQRILRALADRYYARHGVEGDLEAHAFVAAPSGGATVMAV
jgi:galactokinase